MKLQLIVSDISPQDYPVILAKLQEAQQILNDADAQQGDTVILQPYVVSNPEPETAAPTDTGKKRGRPGKVADEHAAPKKFESVVSEETPSPETAKAVLDKVLKHPSLGFDSAKILLAEFNAAGFKSLKPLDYPAFIARAEKLINDAAQ